MTLMQQMKEKEETVKNLLQDNNSLSLSVRDLQLLQENSVDQLNKIRIQAEQQLS